MRRRTVASWALGFAGMAVVGACSSSPPIGSGTPPRLRSGAPPPISSRTPARIGSGAASRISSGAPPLRVCGTVLWSGADGAVLIDETRSTPVVTSVSADAAIYLRLGAGCARGVRFSYPHGAATVAGVARASDRLPAAIALRPRDSEFDVHVTQPGQRARTIEVRLGKPRRRPPR